MAVDDTVINHKYSWILISSSRLRLLNMCMRMLLCPIPSSPWTFSNRRRKNIPNKNWGMLHNGMEGVPCSQVEIHDLQMSFIEFIEYARLGNRSQNVGLQNVKYLQSTSHARTRCALSPLKGYLFKKCHRFPVYLEHIELAIELWTGEIRICPRTRLPDDVPELFFCLELHVLPAWANLMPPQIHCLWRNCRLLQVFIKVADLFAHAIAGRFYGEMSSFVVMDLFKIWLEYLRGG